MLWPPCPFAKRTSFKSLRFTDSCSETIGGGRVWNQAIVAQAEICDHRAANKRLVKAICSHGEQMAFTREDRA